MKKTALLFAAAAMSAGVFAGLPSYVMFSSTGPDKYADGTPVLDGEVYALVWTRAGTTFAGFNADGTVVDAENSKLVSSAPIATGSHCPPVMYMLTGENSDLDSKGSFSVYLLDTRVKSAAATTVGGKNVEGKTVVTAINATTAVATAVKGGASASATEAPAAGAVVSAVPADAPNPRITAVDVVGGQVIVKVADTKPYLQYGISAGKTPSKLDQTDLVDGVNGTDGVLTLIVDDPAENRFFKVIRK